MTPKLAMATNILGGVPTFIGQYPEVAEVLFRHSLVDEIKIPIPSH